MQTVTLSWVCLSVNVSNLRVVFSVRSFTSRDSVVGVETMLHAGRSEVRIAIGATREAHPAFHSLGTKVLFGGLSGRGVILTTNLHLARRLRISGGVPVLLWHAFVVLTGTTSHVPFNFRINAVVQKCLFVPRA